MNKKITITGAEYDLYTQEDVEKYHEAISRMSQERKRKGKDEWLLWRRSMVKTDLYYLLVYEAGFDFMVQSETDDEIIYRPWIFNRCQEVQYDPDFHVDIWARGHFKSTIITIGKTVQDILINPEISIAIFSYSAPSAQAFVSLVRSILERPNMKELFPDVIPEEPSKGKYKAVSNGKEYYVRFTWTNSEFTVKRKNTARKEATLSGWGLINSMPTGKHFDILVYDDVVTPLSIVTQSQNEKTFQRWQDSLNTGSGENTKIRIIGTFYSNRDTYYYILNPSESPDGSSGDGKAKSLYSLRRYPCRDSKGNAVLYTDEYLRNKESMMVGYVYATQMECNPQHGDGMRFLEEWIPERISQKELLQNKEKYNFYLLVDPAYTKSERSDYTAMVMVAATSQRKYIFCDIIRDKLTLSEKVDRIFELENKWFNGRAYPTVFYEANSTASDYSVLSDEMRKKSFYFPLRSVSTKPKINIGNAVLGKPLKHNRIMAMEPLWRRGDIFLVDHAYHVNWKRMNEDMMEAFVSELLNYPYSDHDDLVDAASRIADLETGVMISFPSHRLTPEERRKQFRLVKARDVFTIKEGGYEPFRSSL